MLRSHNSALRRIVMRSPRGRNLPVSGPVLAAAFLTMLLATAAAQAQTFHVLHNFSGREDGGGPNGLTADRNGNLYGTTAGSNPGDGIVYKLSRAGSGWIVTPLYRFVGGSDGSHPG